MCCIGWWVAGRGGILSHCTSDNPFFKGHTITSRTFLHPKLANHPHQPSTKQYHFICILSHFFHFGYSSWTAWPLKMLWLCSSKMWGTTHPVTQHNVPEHVMQQQHHSEKLICHRCSVLCNWQSHNMRKWSISMLYSYICQMLLENILPGIGQLRK